MANAIDQLNTALDNIMASEGVDRNTAARILRGEIPRPSDQAMVPAAGTGTPTMKVKPGLDWKQLEEAQRAAQAREQQAINELAFNKGVSTGRVDGTNTLESVKYANSILADPQNAALAEQIRRGYALGDIPGQTVSSYLNRSLGDEQAQGVSGNTAPPPAAAPAANPAAAAPAAARPQAATAPRPAATRTTAAPAIRTAAPAPAPAIRTAAPAPAPVATGGKYYGFNTPEEAMAYAAAYAPKTSTPAPAPVSTPIGGMVTNGAGGGVPAPSPAQVRQHTGATATPLPMTADQWVNSGSMARGYLDGGEMTIPGAAEGAYFGFDSPEEAMGMAAAMRDFTAKGGTPQKFIDTLHYINAAGGNESPPAAGQAGYNPYGPNGVNFDRNAMPPPPTESNLLDKLGGGDFSSLRSSLESPAFRNVVNYTNPWNMYTVPTSLAYQHRGDIASSGEAALSAAKDWIFGRAEGGQVTVGGQPHWIVDNQGKPVAALTEDNKPEMVKGKAGVEVVPLDPQRHAAYEARKKNVPGLLNGGRMGQRQAPSRRPGSTPGNSRKTQSGTRATLPDGSVANTRPSVADGRSGNGKTNNGNRDPLGADRGRVGTDKDAQSIRPTATGGVSDLAAQVQQKIQDNGPTPVKVTPGASYMPGNPEGGPLGAPLTRRPLLGMPPRPAPVAAAPAPRPQLTGALKVFQPYLDQGTMPNMDWNSVPTAPPVPQGTELGTPALTGPTSLGGPSFPRVNTGGTPVLNTLATPIPGRAVGGPIGIPGNEVIRPLNPTGPLNPAMPATAPRPTFLGSGGPRVMGNNVAGAAFGFDRAAPIDIANRNVNYGVKNNPGVAVQAGWKWSPRTLRGMNPSDRAMLESQVRATGQNPADFYNQAQYAQPGQASVGRAFY